MYKRQALGGQKLNAFPQQDHEAHMDAHRAFMSSMLVRQNPQVMSILQGHISEHISLLATEQVQEKMKEQIQQVQQMMMQAQQDPQLQQQAQQAQQTLDVELAKMIAIITGEITNKMLEEESEMIEERSQDPLVDLKQQEIDLREKDIQRKAMEEQQKLDFQKEKLGQNTDMQKEKIESQEDIAQLRANVNLEKMDKDVRNKKVDLKETEIRRGRR